MLERIFGKRPYPTADKSCVISGGGFSNSNIIVTIQENIHYIGHFHTGGNPGRHEIDETQEINYPAVMRAIAETDYDLYVGHEFIPKGDAIESLRAAFHLCAVG